MNNLYFRNKNNGRIVRVVRGKYVDIWSSRDAGISAGWHFLSATLVRDITSSGDWISMTRKEAFIELL